MTISRRAYYHRLFLNANGHCDKPGTRLATPASNVFVRLLLLLFASFPAILNACSCGPLSSAPACELLGHSDVIFRGQVIGIEDVRTPPATYAIRFHRFRVDRAYQGLDPKTTEILINGDSWTTCRANYSIGREYLMFARSMSDTQGKPLLISSICSGSRPAENAAADIAYLESYRKGETQTRIFGKAVQFMSAFVGRMEPDELIPAAGAAVTLRQGDVAWQRITTPSGDYSFDDVPTGEYQVSVQLPGFHLAPQRRKLAIVAGGCAERWLEMRSSTRVSGRVVDRRGAPVPGVEVELVPRNSDGAWMDSNSFFTRSNTEGYFKFEQVPATQYLLGHSIRHDRPSYYSPRSRVYFPGVSARAAAQPIQILPEQKLDGLLLTLPDPDQPRPITVRISWPDGTPPGPHLLQVSASDGTIHNGPGNAIVYIARGFANRSYKINARYWFDDLSNPEPAAGRRLSQSNTVTVEPGTAPITVHLILGPPSVPPPL